MLASNITHRADGLPKSLAYGNGLTETRTHDQKGQLLNQALGSDTHDYSYDLNGNLVEQVRAGTSLYTYDALDRLISETSASIGNLGYSYDPNGNRLSLLDNGETKTYAYSPNTNRLTQVGHKDIVLDAAGNTLSKDNGKWKYEYGQSGRLLKVYKGRKLVATYLYNAQSQRTQKITKHGTTLYHYDLNGQLIAETAKDGTLQRAYVWLDDMPLAQIDVKGKENHHRRKPRKERIAYLHSDHLGTPRLATDANQQIVWRWESDAFGSEKPEHEDEVDDDHKDITVNLRFAGQYYDKETKLHYNWNRYYDPKTGRYLTSDLIGLGGGFNTYAYVENNPLRYVDPLGLMGSRGVTPSTPRSTLGVFGCLIGCVNSTIDGNRGPQASLEATVGGGIEICEDDPPQQCEAPKKPKNSCGIYDPNCDDKIQPPDLPIPTRRIGLGYIVGVSVKRDGKICMRFGLFGSAPLVPSLELGGLDER